MSDAQVGGPTSLSVQAERADESLFFLDRVEIFRDVLRRTLSGNVRQFADWFSDYRRLRILASLIDSQCDQAEMSVLNVGCGPFTAEALLRPLAGHMIQSFDYTRAFMAVYPALRQEGFLPNTNFVIADANTVEYSASSFDLIVMNDILYEHQLSLRPMVEKFRAYLKPGGAIIFDLMDRRCERLGRWIGSGQDYRRYSIGEEVRLLRANGWDVVAVVPNLGNKRGPPRWLRWTVWRCSGVATNFSIMVRANSTKGTTGG